MSLPREPRQKMINMMYLVLTALLALNVSNEVLNAFKTVNNSLERSNTTVNSSTDKVMESLEESTKKPETAERAKIWLDKANQVRSYSKTVADYIDELKKQIMTGAKYDPTSGKDKGVDNLDVATRIMVDKGAGVTLKNKLEEFRKNVLAVDPKISENFSQSLPINTEMPKTENKSNRTWEAAYFHMVPTIAALTILSKFQNDVKTSENKVVTFCHEQVKKVEIIQDTYAAIAVADATYILPGQDVNVTAGVGGFSTKVSPRITINGQAVNVDANDGTAKMKIKGSGLGKHSIPVHIEYTDQNNKLIKVDKNIDYMVGQSNAAVQLDKMNVLFIGVKNPITVSGSGSASQLKVNATGGGIRLSDNGGGGHYLAEVNSETDDCTISVTTPDGKTTPMRFRVRSIPDPTPYVGAYESGDVPAANFKSQAGVRAYVKNFFYETQFNVTSFRILGDGAGFEEGVVEKMNTGAAWRECRTIIDRCKQGSFITIDEIRAVGPDGRSRKLTPLVFQLK